MVKEERLWGKQKKNCDGGIAAADDKSVYYNMMIPTLITQFSAYETNEGRPLVLLAVLMIMMLLLMMFITE
jgi:hypothetical protein